tara:strand:+ start:2562 stop:2849 length:288 start_codon:yes stop_codon:yes gene_type:complete
MIINTNARFQTYLLTDAELKAAVTFNDLQRANIQNLVADYANELVMGAGFDEDDTTVPAMKKRAFTQGAIAALEGLLASLEIIQNEDPSQTEQGD